SFSGADGRTPQAALLQVVSGTLYGTTTFGGTNGGFGTIYSVDPSTGSGSALYSFSGSDGYQPTAALIPFGGLLYGTTGFGGFSCAAPGCGTVFGFDPSTSGLSVLHSFTTSGGDGTNPFASMVNVSGLFYGTTQFGGSGDGTIYTFDPSSSAES